MLWEAVYGQDDAIRFLRGSLDRGNLSHAYLFGGPAGVGKMLTARVFAAYLLYPPELQRVDAARDRVLRDMHPDVHVLRPQGQTIRIEEVRELIGQLNQGGLEGHRRIAIIDDADALGQGAANALLKILEEPPGDCHIICVTSRPDGLLPTVRSRLQPVRFRPLPPGEIIRYLTEHRGVAHAEAERLAAASGGLFGKVISALREPERLEQWEQGVKRARAVPRMTAYEALRAGQETLDTVDRLVKGMEKKQAKRFEDYADTLDTRSRKALEKRLEEDNKRELRRESTRLTFDILDGMASWFRDIMIWRLSEERPQEAGLALMNLGMEQALRDEAHLLYPEAAVECVRMIGAAKRALSRNANQRLTLENLFLEMRRVAAPEYTWPGV
ncbi:MAG: DNA polymerase III subunit [Candidatus Geothermincolia bacterium]